MTAVNPWISTDRCIRAIIVERGPTHANGESFMRVLAIDEDAELMLFNDPEVGMTSNKKFYYKQYPERSLWVCGHFPRQSPFFVTVMYRRYAKREKNSGTLQIDMVTHRDLQNVSACRVVVHKQTFDPKFLDNMMNVDTMCKFIGTLGIAYRDVTSKNVNCANVISTITAWWGPILTCGLHKFGNRFDNTDRNKRPEILTPDLYGQIMGRHIRDHFQSAVCEIKNTGMLEDPDTWLLLSEPSRIEIVLGRKTMLLLKETDPETYESFAYVRGDDHIISELLLLPLLSEKFFAVLRNMPIVVEDDFARVIPLSVLTVGISDDTGLNPNIATLDSAYWTLHYAQTICASMCKKLRLYGTAFCTIAQLLVDIHMCDKIMTTPAMVFKDMEFLLSSKDDSKLWSHALRLLFHKLTSDDNNILSPLVLGGLVLVKDAPNIICLPFVSETSKRLASRIYPLITQSQQKRAAKRQMNSVERDEYAAMQAAGMARPIDAELSRLIEDPDTPCFLLFPYRQVVPTNFMAQLRTLLRVKLNKTSVFGKFDGTINDQDSRTSITIMVSLDNWALRRPNSIGITPFDIINSFSTFEREHATSLAVLGAERLDIKTLDEILTLCPRIKKVILAYEHLLYVPSFDTRNFIHENMANYFMFGRVVHDILTSNTVQSEQIIPYDNKQVSASKALFRYIAGEGLHTNALTFAQTDIRIVDGKNDNQMFNYALDLACGFVTAEEQKNQSTLFVYSTGKGAIAQTASINLMLSTMATVEKEFSELETFKISESCLYIDQFRRGIQCVTESAPISILRVGDVVRAHNPSKLATAATIAAAKHAYGSALFKPMVSAGLYRVTAIQLGKNSAFRDMNVYPMQEIKADDRALYSSKVFKATTTINHSASTYFIKVDLVPIDGLPDSDAKTSYVIGVWSNQETIKFPFDQGNVLNTNELCFFVKCPRIVFFYEHGAPFAMHKLLYCLRYVGANLDLIISGCTREEFTRSVNNISPMLHIDTVENHSPVRYALIAARKMAEIGTEPYLMIDGLSKKRQLNQ
jgi:hypothetical protein